MIDTKKFTIVCPSSYTNKVAVIKAIRALSGMGLKEAKDASEMVGTPQAFDLSPSLYSNYANPGAEIENHFRILRNEGVKVGDSVHEILEDLRELATQALQQGEDELANEILQLVLVEKLRRKTI
jgi:Ribosomal protein L7/L12 C-terminal domain